MSPAFQSAPEACWETEFHLLATNAGVARRLAGVLAGHGVSFERQNCFFSLAGTQKFRSVVALLLEVLPASEIHGVGVFRAGGASHRVTEDAGTEFPQLQTLQEWWNESAGDAENRLVTWFRPIVDTGMDVLLANECLIRHARGKRRDDPSRPLKKIRFEQTPQESEIFRAHARTLAVCAGDSRFSEGLFFLRFRPSFATDPKQFLRSALLTLRECSLLPRNIVFEIAESEFSSQPQKLIRACDDFRAEGFGVALVDVLAAGSSVRSRALVQRCHDLISNLEPDFIKLHDRVTKQVENPLYAAATGKLVELSDRICATIIATGVEHTQAMENLWLLGVHGMQGDFFGRAGSRPAIPGKELFTCGSEIHYSQYALRPDEELPRVTIH